MEIISRSYHPAQAATYGGCSHRPLQNNPTFDEADHFSVTVQPFRAGGYEATIRRVDLQRSADIAALPRKFGVRVEPGERSEDSLRVSRQRAKSKVRMRVKDMGGNRLCTLTVRQSDAIGYLSPEEWSTCFARYVRLMRRAGLMSDYVAILEPHKKGLERLRERQADADADQPVQAVWDIPLHIHFVTRSEFKMPINLMRKCWALACGRDSNIDVQWLRPSERTDSIDKVAAYATKYITKGLAEFERFNKKRYWSAGESLLPKGRTWLRSRTLSDAFGEALLRLNLSGKDMGDLITGRRIFMFPDQSGAWINFRPPPNPSPPPF